MRIALSCVVVGACHGGDEVELPDCPVATDGEPPPVAGTFRYSSRIFGLRGTISFEQSDGTLFVTDTTYDNADDRALSGEGPWDGNIATVELFPINGDTDYSASVTFSFTESGSEFCVMSFTDTNGDEGGEGTYVGVRQ